MSAYENAVQSLINGGYPDRQAREILSFVCGEAQNEGHRRGAAAARVELMAEFVAWLVKRAREHRAQGPQYAKQADVIGMLASKVQRGAVRPNNLLMLPPQGGPEDVPALRAEADALRSRVAELEGDLDAGVNAAVRDALVGSAVREARAKALAEAVALILANPHPGVDPVAFYSSLLQEHADDVAAAPAPGAIEYGTAFRATEQAPVEVHSPTASRDEAAARADRYRDMYPVVHVVQRTVRYGEWTEVTA